MPIVANSKLSEIVFDNDLGLGWIVDTSRFNSSSALKKHYDELLRRNSTICKRVYLFDLADDVYLHVFNEKINSESNLLALGLDNLLHSTIVMICTSLPNSLEKMGLERLDEESIQLIYDTLIARADLIMQRLASRKRAVEKFIVVYCGNKISDEWKEKFEIYNQRGLLEETKTVNPTSTAKILQCTCSHLSSSVSVANDDLLTYNPSVSENFFNLFKTEITAETMSIFEKKSIPDAANDEYVIFNANRYVEATRNQLHSDFMELRGSIQNIENKIREMNPAGFNFQNIIASSHSLAIPIPAIQRPTYAEEAWILLILIINGRNYLNLLQKKYDDMEVSMILEKMAQTSPINPIVDFTSETDKSSSGEYRFGVRYQDGETPHTIFFKDPFSQAPAPVYNNPNTSPTSQSPLARR